MRISLIVPVRNESASIQNTLAGILNQEFDGDYEILVIDGRSDDDTAAIVRELAARHPHLHLFDNPKRLASAARNIGVRNATGDYIAIVDGHCRIDNPRFVAAMVEAFETSGADTLGRPQPLRVDEPSDLQRAISVARSSWLGHNPHSAIYSNTPGFVYADNVAVAYRREVFDRVGLFDESFDACEDVEFNTRARLAGFNCYFTPEIAVAYEPRATIRGLAYQMNRYGRGRVRLARRHPSTRSLASLAPPIWLVWLALMTVASAFMPMMSLVLAASLLAYAAVIAVESGRLWRRDRTLPYRRLPIVFATIHAGYGWGYLREILVPALRSESRQNSETALRSGSRQTSETA